MRFIDAVTHITAALIASGKLDALKGEYGFDSTSIVETAITIADQIEGKTNRAFDSKEE